MKERNRKFYLILFLKSILMGTVNKLPGVSGGLVALITGFYFEMINSLKKINLNTIKLFPDLKKLNKEYNLYFLLTIFFGIIVSYFTTSQLLDILFRNHELKVWSIFFGMILASNILLIKKNKNWDLKSTLFVFVGLVIGILISISEPISENRNLYFIFFCGFISICGMIVPGLSGSFLLILLGNFKLLLIDSVNSLYNSILILFGFKTDINHDIELIKIAAVFALGSVAGLILLSNFLSYLITNFKETVNQVIIGFIFGSLFIVWPWNYSSLDFELNFQNSILLLWIVIGVLIIFVFNRYAKKY
jgi:putative membrane protein